MEIFGPQILPRPNGEISLSVKIESEYLGNQELWFSTPEKYANFLCKERLDAFLVGLIYPATHYGEDVHLNGCVSKMLLFNMNRYIVPLLRSFSPSCQPIKITAEEVSSKIISSKGVGTGFSAGVDSFCTIYDRFELEEDPEYKINHLLFLNVGSHNAVRKAATHEEGIQHKFRVRYELLKPFADEVGLDLIPLDSNLHFFHPWGHQKTHTLTSVSGVLAFQSLFLRYYYASPGISYDGFFKYAEIDKDTDIGIYSDPILLPLLGTESTFLLSDGMSLTRAEKIQHVLEYEPVQRYLNVCVNANSMGENCSICNKCCRTLMALESLGKLDVFENLFNIGAYQKVRKRFMCAQLTKSKGDPFAFDNVKLAKENGLHFPNYLWRVYFRICDALKIIAKKVLPNSVLDRMR